MVMDMYKEQDYIKITGLQIYAHHGVLPEEKEHGQDFFINARLYYDMRKPGNSDRIEDALNYAECCQFMTKIFTERNFDLIEAAAEHLCRELLLQFPLLHGIELELRKPHAPIGLPFGDVSVTMTRSWHRAYIAFGSNMGDREKWIHGGIETLRQNPDIRNIRVSQRITTKPYGPVEQEDFLNGCLELETLLSPEDLLKLLHRIEADAGRKREIHWGPRTLDLDIIFYDKLVYESEDLLIPHVDMQNREFVLQPLAELCPNYRHPLLGLTVSQMWQMCRKGETAEDESSII